MDAFYQCYNKLETVKFVIDNFIKHAGGTVFLFSDAGEDFSNSFVLYGSRVKYTYCQNNLGIKWKSMEAVTEGLGRICAACKQASGVKMMYLEDDVLINGDITNLQLDHEICGPKYHGFNGIQPCMNKFINDYGKIQGDYRVFGGCGGSIFNRQIFADNYEWYVKFLTNNFEELDKLSDENIRRADYCMTVMFNLLGYSYGSNPDYIEPLYQDEYQKTKHYKKIIHRFDGSI